MGTTILAVESIGYGEWASDEGTILAVDPTTGALTVKFDTWADDGTVWVIDADAVRSPDESNDLYVDVSDGAVYDVVAA